MALAKFTESQQWAQFSAKQRSSIENAGSISKQTTLFKQYCEELGLSQTPIPITMAGVGIGAGAGIIGTTTPTITPATTLTATQEMLMGQAAQFRQLEAAAARGGTTPITGYSQDIIDSYNNYLEWLKLPENKTIPQYSIEDWLLYRDDIAANLQYYQAGYTHEQISSYDRFKAFASQYGNLNDFLPQSLGEYLDNYNQAQQQLNSWIQEAGPEATGFTDAQIQDFNAYKQWYYQYGKPGDLMPVDVGDFITRYDEYQQQLGVWQQEAAAVEKYELTPEEAARRREESYAETRYAAEERYGETPMYQETFAKWIQGQGGVSQALKSYIESEYPSLRAEYEAGLPRLTGYPTREEARAEAAQRETGFQAWLTQRQPETYQQYMMQRPYARGERYAEYSPTTRQVNFGGW